MTNPAQLTANLLTIEGLSPDLVQSLSQATHFARCEVDVAYWAMNHGWVDVRGEGLKPLQDVAWPFQRGLLNLLQHEGRLIVLKARQLGVSTLIMHYLYHRIRYGKDRGEYGLVLSKSKEDAAYLLGKLPTINNNQPPEIRMNTLTERTFMFQLENENAVECVAATEHGGRSRAATVIVLDEHAFHAYAEKNWAAIKPTLDGGGTVILVSTGNGVGNLFHTKWVEAKEGVGDFKPVFIPFSAAPHRNKDWYEKEKADYGQNLILFHQEYPRNDDEAFTKTGSSPFDLAWVSEQILAADQRPPAMVSNEGRARIFEKPRTEMQYAAGLDCAQGLSATGRPDKTSLKIVDRNGKHVASWDGRMELSDTSSELMNLLTLYRPFLVVERNGPGSGMIAALKALGYNHFYHYEESHINPDAKPEKTPRVGCQMTPVIKSRLISNLTGWINSHGLISSDTTFWREVTTFVQMGPSKWGAQGGNNDDEVIAMAWALWGLSYLPRQQQPRRKNRRIRWA